jgi:NADH-quinone oxidoreductase subunit N
LRKRTLSPAVWSGISSLAALAMLALSIFSPGPEEAFRGSYLNDAYAQILKQLLIGAVFLASMLSYDFVKGRSRWIAEYYAMLWFALLGMMLMVSAGDLILLFVATETTTITLYILTGFFKGEKASVEAGLKYLMLGAMFAAIMIYGMALIYGATGSVNLREIAGVLLWQTDHPKMLFIGGVLLLIGFSFKLAAVPFHHWAPDVYQGAPTPITAFLSVASKAAGFAVLIRVFYTALGPVQADMKPFLWVLAGATMIVGNLVALTQRDIKRLLAYSSISQAGYILVGASAFSDLGASSAVFYLAAYLFSNFGAFACVVVLYATLGSDDSRDYAGLGRRSPILALCMMLSLLSLSGIPPLAGFFGKLYLFAAAMEQGQWWLVLIGILASTVSIFYYLTILRRMYIDEPKEHWSIAISAPSRVVLWVTMAGILLLGIFPGLVADLTREAGRLLLGG